MHLSKPQFWLYSWLWSRKGGASLYAALVKVFPLVKNSFHSCFVNFLECFRYTSYAHRPNIKVNQDQQNDSSIVFSLNSIFDSQ